MRLETLRTSNFDSFVRGPGKDAGVAVEHAADALAGAHLSHHQLDPLPVGLHARLALLVVGLKAADIRMHALQPHFDGGVGKGGKNHVRLLDMAARQRREVGAQGHAHADAGQAAAGCVVGCR